MNQRGGQDADYTIYTWGSQVDLPKNSGTFMKKRMDVAMQGPQLDVIWRDKHIDLRWFKMI